MPGTNQNAKFARSYVGRCFLCLLVLVICVFDKSASAQETYDPEHPDVQRLITNGMDFLEGNATSNRIGNQVMVGMAAYKSQFTRSPNPKDHPLVTRAVEAIQDKCSAENLAGLPAFEKMYASALACVFLLELDPDAYEDEIKVLLTHIESRQQESGGWGYRSERPERGDVSQMQYVALALWLASEKGFDVDYKGCQAALNWMLVHQEDDGGWNYKYPPDPRATNRALSQTVRPPLVAAGLGTIYLYTDLLRLRMRLGKLGARISVDSELPPDVVDVTNEKDRDGDDEGPRAKVDRGQLVRAINNGNRWFQDKFSPACDHYNMYFLYGFERYAALREYLDGENRGVEDWYDQGVDFLKGIQAGDGSMVAGDQGEVSSTIQTAFAILFLTRSMTISIGSGESIILSAGQGIPANVILLDEGEGKIPEAPVSRSVSSMLEAITNPDLDQSKMYLWSLNSLNLDADETTRNAQLATLRALVTHENFDARLIAVRFLAEQRSLDNVPAFIYALTDPDERVVAAANEALRFVSRKTTAPKIEEGKRPSRTEINELKRFWKEWFIKVKPDGILLQEPDEDN